MWQWFHRLSAPKYFYTFANKLIPWFAVMAVALFSYGLVGGLYFAPADYQQGDAFRIIYVHVPCAFLSLMVYVTMTMAALIAYVWQIKLADMLIKVSAPLGAWFTFLALATGAIWGKPMWGTWWVWDARLTSELILLFIYFGIIGLQSAIADNQVAARAVRIMVLVGFINIPIIHYSVYWWNTLHQGSTLKFFAASLIAPSMLHPLLAMIAGFSFYYGLVLLIGIKREILLREGKTQWVQEVLL